jgi:ABC-type glycerol-3-phosphate transport system permease component
LYLARTYFETIPQSLLESARIDGATEFQVLGKIVFPISIPIITALSIFASVGALQDYIWQALVLQDPNKQTLLVGLMRYSMERGGGDLALNPIGRGLAVGTVLLLPLLVIFLLANRYFVSSIGGAVKE